MCSWGTQTPSQACCESHSAVVSSPSLPGTVSHLSHPRKPLAPESGHWTVRKGLMASCTVSTQVAGERQAAGCFARCFGRRWAGSLAQVFNGNWCHGNTWIINNLTPKGTSHGGPTPEHPPRHPEWRSGLDAAGQALTCVVNPPKHQNSSKPQQSKPDLLSLA